MGSPSSDERMARGATGVVPLPGVMMGGRQVLASARVNCKMQKRICDEASFFQVPWGIRAH